MMLRKATDADCNFFYELRIDPVASRMSRRIAPILADHLKWWQQTTDLRLVAEASFGSPEAADNTKLGIFRVSHDGVVSIIVHPGCRGMGVGARMLQLLDRVAKDAGHTHLMAEIAYENTPSQRAFLRAEWKPVLLEKFL